MKIAIVKASQWENALRLWKAEAEMEAADAKLQRRVEGAEKARAELRCRQNDVLALRTKVTLNWTNSLGEQHGMEQQSEVQDQPSHPVIR